MKKLVHKGTIESYVDEDEDNDDEDEDDEE